MLPSKVRLEVGVHTVSIILKIMQLSSCADCVAFFIH